METANGTRTTTTATLSLPLQDKNKKRTASAEKNRKGLRRTPPPVSSIRALELILEEKKKCRYLVVLVLGEDEFVRKLRYARRGEAEKDLPGIEIILDSLNDLTRKALRSETGDRSEPFDRYRSLHQKVAQVTVGDPYSKVWHSDHPCSLVAFHRARVFWVLDTWSDPVGSVR